jgi:pimeloyl-ACP methyl ester carboxylesterase
MSTLQQGLLIALLLTIALYLAMAARRRRRKAGKRGTTAMRPGSKPRSTAVYTAKLAGFSLLILLVILLGAVSYINFLFVDAYAAPAPSQVELPTGLPFQVEDVTITTNEGWKLAGWFIAGEKDATIILLHGYYSTRVSMLWHAGVLAQAGYSVLLYDERAAGESEGDHRSFGWEDPADVQAALAYLDQRPDTRGNRVGIAGCSIGGQIALQAAAYNPEIVGVWADGPAVITRKDLPTPSTWFTLLSYPSDLLADRMLADRIGGEIPTALIDLIGSIEPRPVMLVAGGQPNPLYGPETLRVSNFYAHAGPHASLWAIPEATHYDGHFKRPVEYAARLVEFFDHSFENTP